MKTVGVLESFATNSAATFFDFDLVTPVATGKDLLVRIDGISINPVDLKERRDIVGKLDEPLVLGWDACGEVISVGDDVQAFKVGDKVMYAGEITRPGCYAEFQLVDERIVGPKPYKLTSEEAACLPLTSLAAWEALFDRLEIGRIAEENTALLIIGGAGGLGSMAIQFARQLSKCKVISTASREKSKDWCLKMGAHHVIDHSKNIKSQLVELGHDTVPLILNLSDNIPYWEVMADIVSPEGAICLVASTKAKLDLDLFMGKSVRINYELMFTRSMYSTNKMSVQSDILRNVAEMIDSGRIIHTKTESMGNISAENITKAHARVETGRMIGKVTLSGGFVAQNSC
ncbi:alcohol dehydrogenase [Jannaschia faecimaris]|uniref:Zinc-type alcohol dehydrogenase-like protein n=1 Tax=Jannaschia faecimaris TaxID=1244108 RepID=A0A1H3UK15_9RHOB|nr:zinc-binding alcohol dehydrogenase family protein [Jannaschia faecimaris]SDZ62734.1 alcohol dehydrogenase [Jannaschia faecimaris]